MFLASFENSRSIFVQMLLQSSRANFNNASKRQIDAMERAES